MQTRPATLADLKLLVELGRRTFFDTFVGTCTDEDMQLFLDSSFAETKVEQELRHPLSRFLLLEDGFSTLGYSRLMGETGVRVELVRFYLVQQAIGTGAAHVLMEDTLELARTLNYREVFLGVWEKNFRAQRFYEKWGFRKTGEKIFPVGNDPQVDWQYERSL